MPGIELNPSEVQRWRSRSPRSEALWQKTKALIPTGHAGGMGFFLPYPLVVARAKGCWLWDVDDNRYLDLRLGDWVLIHGHCDDDINAALARQANRHLQIGAPEWDCAYELAAALVDRTTSIDKVRFFVSGTDANLAAIRMARAYTGRYKIAKVIGSYHGTADALIVGHSILRDPDDLLPPGVPAHAVDEIVEFPYNDPDAATAILERESGALAAIIVEPCLSAAGMIEATRDFLQRLREIATRLRIVLIFDEVVTYPTYYGGAQEFFGVIPDLTTLGKAIGGGLPVSAVGGRRDLMDILEPDANGGKAPVSIMSTFGGNSLGMAAGSETLKKLTREAHRQLNDLGDLARAQINALGKKHGIPLHATGIGHLIGIHWAQTRVVDYPTRLADDREKIMNINLALCNEGFYQTFVGMFLLSTAIGSAEVASWIDALDRVLVRLGYGRVS